MKKFTITVAKTAGFCFGVDRAVKLVYNEIENGHKAVTLGEIIHNPDVVGRFAAMGVRVVLSPEDAADGETVVIRSHGVGPEVYARLAELKIPFADGTCPFVRRIQKLAAGCADEGIIPVIIGDETHPEVVGIAAHGGKTSVVLAGPPELEDFLKKNSENIKKRVAIMPQTTYNISMWQKCRDIIARFPEAEGYDTICSATSERQSEALKLAGESDMMIVIGGRHSSNTKKLYDTCCRVCGIVLLVENGRDLNNVKMPKGFSDKCDIRIGITAGASTPADIIEEVKNQMSEKMIMDEDFNFEEALEASFRRVYKGNRVKGVITSVSNTEATVDIGVKYTGYISLDELTDDPALKPADVVKVGDEVDLIVIKTNDQDGTVLLSKKRVDAAKGLDEIAKAKEEGTVLEGTVTGVVKGGVIVLTNGVKVFIPASQATLRRDEKLEELVKTIVKFKVIEVNEQRGRAVGSIKQVLSAERDSAKSKFWESVQVGDVFKGAVKSITSYGAFVDLGGIDGMVHISELSWNRIKHPSEVASVGDELEVFVKKLDAESGRISLGYRKDEDNPWNKFTSECEIGSVITGKVVSITPFGAFVQIMPGIDGLVHISQVSDKRVNNVNEVLSVGDEVTAKITDIDSEKQRISLSIRELAEGASEE